MSIFMDLFGALLPHPCYVKVQNCIEIYNMEKKNEKDEIGVDVLDVSYLQEDERDEFDIIGENIATKLRMIRDNSLRENVRAEINSLLCVAMLKEYQNNQMSGKMNARKRMRQLRERAKQQLKQQIKIMEETLENDLKNTNVKQMDANKLNLKYDKSKDLRSLKHDNTNDSSVKYDDANSVSVTSDDEKDLGVKYDLSVKQNETKNSSVEHDETKSPSLKPGDVNNSSEKEDEAISVLSPNKVPYY